MLDAGGGQGLTSAHHACCNVGLGLVSSHVCMQASLAVHSLCLDDIQCVMRPSCRKEQGPADRSMISVLIDESIVDCFTWALWRQGKLSRYEQPLKTGHLSQACGADQGVGQVHCTGICR